MRSAKDKIYVSLWYSSFGRSNSKECTNVRPFQTYLDNVVLLWTCKFSTTWYINIITDMFAL